MSSLRLIGRSSGSCGSSECGTGYRPGRCLCCVIQLRHNLARCTRILKSCRNDGNRSLIGHGLIVLRTEDDVGIVACEILYIACRIIRIHKRNITGNIDDDVGSTVDGCLKQRAGNCKLDCLDRLVVSLGITDTDVSHTLVLHDGRHICEIEVDECRQVD